MTRALRRVYVAQFVGSTIDGIALSTAVLYFSTRVGLAPEAIGVVLAAGAAAALLLAVPIGMLADAVGLRRAAVALSVLVAGALTIYALADSLWLYAIGAVLFLVSQAGIGAVRQALVASNVGPSERVRGRAVLHTLLNAGMGLGTVVGTVVAVIDSRLPFVIAFGSGGVAALVCGAILFGLPRQAAHAGAASAAARRPGLVVLRDRGFVTITALASLIQLTMPVLSVLLPLWITTRSAAPEWVAPVVLVINTAIVLAAQTPWTSRVRTDADAARSTLIASVGLAVGCTLLGLASVGGALPAVILLIVGTVVVTVGEITAGAGTWHLAFTGIPATSPGQYQAVFGMSGAVARILGPLLALPLVLTLGIAGWVIVGLVMAGAAVALTVIGRRRSRERS